MSVREAAGAYWDHAKPVLPFLLVASVFIDIFLINSIEPTSPLNLVVGLGIFVGLTFAVLLGAYLFWLYIGGAVRRKGEES
jgi:hypothetical protein